MLAWVLLKVNRVFENLLKKSMNGKEVSVVLKGIGARGGCLEKGALHAITLVCVCVVVLSTAIGVGPQEAFADEPERVLEREFSYDAVQQESYTVEPTLELDGAVYRLTGVSDPQPAAGVIHSKEYTAQETRYLPVEVVARGEAAVRSQFDAALPYEDDEFAGSLDLLDVQWVPAYRTVERQIEREEVFANLPHEDTAVLPFERTYTTSGNAALGATVEQVLKMTGVTWATTGYDADGRPNRFTATVTYRGVERELVIDYYEAQAQYGGTIPARAQMVTVVATYEREAAPAPAGSITQAPAPVAATPVVPAPAAAFDFLPLLVAAAVVAVLLGLVLLFWFFLYRNARLLEYREGCKAKVLLRRHLKVVEGTATFTIPNDCALGSAGTTHTVMLGRFLVRHGGQLVVVWRERQILATPLAREVNLGERLITLLGSEALDAVIGDDYACA